MEASRHSAPRDLGARLSRRRREMTATPEQVARWAGLPSDRVTAIEAGASMTSWELEDLSRALAVDSGAFVQGEARHPRRSLARFRSAPGASSLQAADLRLLSLGAEAGRIGGFLARELGHPILLTTYREALPVQERELPWKQGYRLGEAARGRLLPKPGPVVDLEVAMEKLGVHVARVPFREPRLEAASLWSPGTLPVVLINDRSSVSLSALSRRALLAHELCHLLHDSGEQDPIAQLTWDEGAGGWTEDIEQRARAFAPAFLAPRNEVCHWFRAGEGRTIHQPAHKVRALARRWGFSLKGAVWHAKNCQIILSATAKRLAAERTHDTHDWERDFERQAEAEVASRLEPVDTVSPVFAGSLERLVHRAAATGIISEGRAQEILTWR